MFLFFVLPVEMMFISVDIVFIMLYLLKTEA